jgi:phosphoribosylformimino-5-aminoimidazole carboxamide ribotide isomerase
MKLVAVIDLLDGQVVHARRGDRASYASLNSRLCEGSDPAEVASVLIALHAFDAIYVADLNAIQRRGENLEALRAIARAVGDTELWIDAGIGTIGGVDRLRAEGYVSIVVGSESLHDCEIVDQLSRAGDEYILSLDFLHSRFLGPENLRESPGLWPKRVLAMNLDFVGSSLGPDLHLVRALHNAAPSSLIYAAGGLRNEADLDAACRAGATGALLATSLHDGSLSAYFTRLRGKGSSHSLK